VTVTEAPAGLTEGASEIAGADVAAKVDVNGRRRAAATMTIVAVAAKTRRRELRRVLRRVCVRVSGTHRVPSQKANAVLRSATRLTLGVPWLCGPASRRVCYFVEADQAMRSARRALAAQQESTVRDPIGLSAFGTRALRQEYPSEWWELSPAPAVRQPARRCAWARWSEDGAVRHHRLSGTRSGSWSNAILPNRCRPRHRRRADHFRGHQDHPLSTVSLLRSASRRPASA
jgi:hypothetical protein